MLLNYLSMPIREMKIQCHKLSMKTSFLQSDGTYLTKIKTLQD